MERHGFIRDMLDVKVLILYVMARIAAPTDSETIYALCYQDESLSYFDLKTALPELVQSGHLELFNNLYAITEKGREQGAVMEDAIPFPLLQRCADAVAQHNQALRQRGCLKSEILVRAPGDHAAVLTISDGVRDSMRLELAAPDPHQAEVLHTVFEQNADKIYSQILHIVLDYIKEVEHAAL